MILRNIQGVHMNVLQQDVSTNKDRLSINSAREGYKEGDRHRETNRQIETEKQTVAETNERSLQNITNTYLIKIKQISGKDV